jgi:23S rRNA pseudouridine1911/1915/1917 synthase
VQTEVSEDQAGLRLDSFVTANMPRLSRAYAQILCDTDRVRVNDHPRKSGYKLHIGDKVIIEYDEKELDVIPDINLPILYEDDDCVVINKPAGVLTHTQGAFNPEATVATFLRGKINGELNGEATRAGVVHRLDRATSGVIIGAKNQAALSWLQKQFAQRKVHKTYVAVVEGHLKEPEAVIDMPIERNPKAPATFRTGPNGKDAITRYSVIEEGPNYSLLELKPETGRTHQLRVHMQKIGHPIVGDPLYGGGQFGDRMFLHAVSLEITLPNRERKTFEASVPAEFEEQANA